MLRVTVVLAVVLGVDGVCFAQLHSNHRKTPINYLGRLTGFGYSDGYHECRGPGCGEQRNWLGVEPMSSFYGVPSPPVAHHRQRPMPSYAPYQAAQMYGDGHAYFVPPGSGHSVHGHAMSAPVTPMPQPAREMPPAAVGPGPAHGYPPPASRSLLPTPAENQPMEPRMEYPRNDDLLVPQNVTPPGPPPSDPYDLRPSSPEAVPAVPANPSARRTIPGSRNQAYRGNGYGYSR